MGLRGWAAWLAVGRGQGAPLMVRCQRRSGSSTTKRRQQLLWSLAGHQASKQARNTTQVSHLTLQQGIDSTAAVAAGPRQAPCCHRRAPPGHCRRRRRPRHQPRAGRRLGKVVLFAAMLSVTAAGSLAHAERWRGCGCAQAVTSSLPRRVYTFCMLDLLRSSIDYASGRSHHQGSISATSAERTRSVGVSEAITQTCTGHRPHQASKLSRSLRLYASKASAQLHRLAVAFTSLQKSPTARQQQRPAASRAPSQRRRGTTTRRFRRRLRGLWLAHVCAGWTARLVAAMPAIYCHSCE